MISSMNRKRSRRGQPNTSLTVHGLSTRHGLNLNRYANIAKFKNALSMGYINHRRRIYFKIGYGDRLLMALVT